MKTLTPQIAAMYLGCKIIIENRAQPDKMGILTPTYIYDTSGIVLALRKLSSMTEEEKKELIELMRWGESKNLLPPIKSGPMLQLFINKKDPEYLIWLLSKSFDLFNLIEDGLAIDRDTLKEAI